MKFRYIIILFIVLWGCNDKFEEMNVNPNYPTSSDPNYIFTHVVKQRAGEFGIFQNYNANYIQRWIMQTAAVYGNSTMPPYELFDQYRIEQLWELLYSDILLNNTILENLTKDDPDLINKYQIARIWKVFSMYLVTDLWGDVPYSEAWGLIDDYSSELLSPKFDTQESIYTDILAILGDAVKNFDSSKAVYPYDPIFDGDITKWIKFANSLRLRLALRSGNQAVITEILNENNLISNNDESAVFQYLNDQNWWNPYYESHINSLNSSQPDYTGTSVIKISELMVRALTQNNDPRLSVYAQPIETNNTTFVGVPNLMNSNLKENQAMMMGVYSTSYIGTHFSRTPDLKKPLLSYAEVCFMRAEIAFRGWSSESAQDWFKEGVTASLDFYGITDTNFVNTVASAPVTLETIITQKWIALYLDGWEAYADYRRTGYPQLMKWDLDIDYGPPMRITAADWVEVPRNYVPGRLPYPTAEKYFNEERFLEAVERQGGDDYYQQVWWAKKFGEVNY